MEASYPSNRDNPVIILTTGRSGSTLLQKLLNTNPELVIWGEHAGILNPMMNAYYLVENNDWIKDDLAKGAWMLQPTRPIDPDRWTAWDGPFSKAEFYRSLKKFTDSLFCENVPSQMRWGFKEIRYFDERFIDFMLTLYPGAKFIVLMRNPVSSCVSFATSMLLKESAQTDSYLSKAESVAKNQVKRAFAFFKWILAQDRDDVCAIKFEELVDDPFKTLERIQSFLELERSFEIENISKVAARDIISQRKRTPPEIYDLVNSHAAKLLAEEALWYESVSTRQMDRAKN
jgi:hypothetical protein